MLRLRERWNQRKRAWWSVVACGGVWWCMVVYGGVCRRVVVVLCFVVGDEAAEVGLQMFVGG